MKINTLTKNVTLMKKSSLQRMLVQPSNHGVPRQWGKIHSTHDWIVLSTAVITYIRLGFLNFDCYSTIFSMVILLTHVPHKGKLVNT